MNVPKVELKHLIPFCTAIAIVVLVLEFLLRQDLIRQAKDFQEVLSDAQVNRGNSRKRDRSGRFTAGDLGGNTGVGTTNGSGPVEAKEDQDS